MSETPQERGRFHRFHRFRKHRVTRWTLAILLLFISYRILAVYTIRRSCAAPRDVQVVAAKMPPTARPPGTHLTILTYNIEGHAALIRSDHLEQIAAVIRESNADIVGLEEVHRGTWQSRFSDQALRLAQLTGMSVAFAPSFTVFGGGFGNAILTRGRLESARVVDLPSIGEPRAMLIGKVIIDGRPIMFHVAHFAAWGGMNSSIRYKQVDCTLDNLRHGNGDFILVGDFNAAPDTPEVAHARTSRDLNFVSPLDVPTHRLMGNTIDYVITSPSLERVSTRVLQSGPSDHWPVVAELQWVPAPGTSRKLR
jgi:endonuclease/exonuclease/phosphatase family metal-dependent hydrolase